MFSSEVCLTPPCGSTVCVCLCSVWLLCVCVEVWGRLWPESGLRRCNFSSFLVVGLLSEGKYGLEVLGLKTLESSRPCGSVIFLLHGFSPNGRRSSTGKCRGD